jgi:hypothetical protein
MNLSNNQNPINPEISLKKISKTKKKNLKKIKNNKKMKNKIKN